MGFLCKVVKILFCAISTETSKNGNVVLEHSCVNLIFWWILLACSKKCVSESLPCGYIRNMSSM